MDNNLIKDLKEIIRCYEICNSHDSDTNKEILMWRERFIDSLPTHLDKRKDQYIRHTFLYIPSDEFMKYTIEKNIKICEEAYEVIK